MKAPNKKVTDPGHGWIYYARDAARIAVCVAALKFVKALLVPPLPGEPRWLVAGTLSFKFWGAGAVLGTF